MPPESILTADAGEYFNIFQDGELRISISEEHNEILVYESGREQPRAKFDLEGSLMDINL